MKHCLSCLINYIKQATKKTAIILICKKLSSHFALVCSKLNGLVIITSEKSTFDTSRELLYECILIELRLHFVSLGVEKHHQSVCALPDSAQ